MTIPDAQTQVAGVVGHPVAHSLSPAIHNAALRHDGRNAVYLAFDVDEEGFEPMLAGFSAAGAVGLNVTLPHKERALGVVDRPSPPAERIGAANTLIWRRESGQTVLEGHNTDPAGVLGALAELDVDPAGARCLVIGAGGAGRAAAWALADAGAATVRIGNRTSARADDVVAGLVDAGLPAERVAWSELDDALDGAEVIVNATSVGLDGRDSVLAPSALERAAVGPCRAVLDLVYGRSETPLVRTARRAGLVAADGLGMLVHQAAAAYALLWGSSAPLEVMAEAAAVSAGRSPVARGPGDADRVPPIV